MKAPRLPRSDARCPRRRRPRWRANPRWRASPRWSLRQRAMRRRRWLSPTWTCATSHSARYHEVKGYRHATEVQDAVLPHIMAGKDVLARAKTGSGKTIAFPPPRAGETEANSSRAQGRHLRAGALPGRVSSRRRSRRSASSCSRSGGTSTRRLCSEAPTSASTSPVSNPSDATSWSPRPVGSSTTSRTGT